MLICLNVNKEHINGRRGERPLAARRGSIFFVKLCFTKNIEPYAFGALRAPKACAAHYMFFIRIEAQPSAAHLRRGWLPLTKQNFQNLYSLLNAIYAFN